MLLPFRFFLSPVALHLQANMWLELNPLLFVAIKIFSKQFTRNWALRSQILLLKILENKFLNATTWPRHFLHDFPPRKTRVAHIHRTIYNILLPPTSCQLIPFHHPQRACGRTEYADVTTKFSRWIVYQIFLPMMLRWRALRVRELR